MADEPTKVEIEIPPDETPQEIEEVKEDVAKLEGKVETLVDVVSEPPEIPEHEHAFHREILERLARVEETADTLVKREVDRTIEETKKPEPEPEPEVEQQEYTAEETDIIPDEVAPEPEGEVTIIEPPPERSKVETPPGVWGLLKKMGF